MLSAANTTYMEKERILEFKEKETTMESNEKLLIDIHELSALTGLAVGTLYRWASASESRVPTVRLSARCLRFSLPAIREWLASLNEPAATPDVSARHRR